MRLGNQFAFCAICPIACAARVLHFDPAMGAESGTGATVVNVLLVDDLPQNLVALESVLGAPDYRLIKATSGEDALRHLLREDFAVILLDVQMPHMDGFETAALIRQRERSRTTPIIFVTAVYGDTQNIGRGYEAGAVDYIIKPFEPTVLKSKVGVFAELFRKNLAIQRQAELLLREQEERARVEAIGRHYHDLLNWLDHSIIWEAEAPGMRFTFVSKRAEEMLGYPCDQWFEEENFFFERIPSADRDRVKQAIECAATSGTEQRCEHRMTSADGQTYWFHTGVQVEGPESKRGLRGLTVDITPLKREEEALQKREAKFRRVVESNMLGHVFGNLDGTVSDVNECFLQMTGYTRAEAMFGALRWFELVPPEQKHLEQRAMHELKTAGVCSPYEVEFRRRDGTRVPVMVGMALMEGSASDWVSFVLDLTERRRTEEERNRAIRAREELLEIVSHDLRNPLGTILMNATLLYRQGPSTQDAHFIRKHVMTIQRSAERMKRLIEDLLDLAQLEAGRFPVSPQADDIVGTLRAAVDLFSPLADEKSITLECDCTSSPILIRFDRERILQVLSNIVGNAIKFTPNGGIVRLALDLGDDQVDISVTDTGPGIPPEHQEHVFERYWRVNSEASNGMGLGLFIAKAIVHAHTGRIWIDSRVGHGTSVHFTLPRAV
jgi:PAS domain S-box-containing protein